MKKSIRELGVITELRGFALFNGFEDPEIEELCNDSQVVVTNHKKELFKAGEKALNFFFVLNGAYKLTKPAMNGEDTIINFSSPGDVIAALIMPLPDPAFPISGISMGPSRALKIPRYNYLNIWNRHPDLVSRIQGLLSTRMASLQQQKALTKSPLQAKVASLLIELADRQPSSEQPTIPIPLTRKEIADSVGASVESIIRIMSDWAKKGYVSTNEKQITILQTAKVIELMGSEF